MTLEMPCDGGVSNGQKFRDVASQVTLLDDEALSSSPKKGIVDVLDWM